DSSRPKSYRLSAIATAVSERFVPVIVNETNDPDLAPEDKCRVLTALYRRLGATEKRGFLGDLLEITGTIPDFSNRMEAVLSIEEEVKDNSRAKVDTKIFSELETAGAEDQLEYRVEVATRLKRPELFGPAVVASRKMEDPADRAKHMCTLIPMV